MFIQFFLLKEWISTSLTYLKGEEQSLNLFIIRHAFSLFNLATAHLENPKPYYDISTDKSNPDTAHSPMMTILS
jgi:hypothetical protein